MFKKHWQPLKWTEITKGKNVDGDTFYIMYLIGYNSSENMFIYFVLRSDCIIYGYCLSHHRSVQRKYCYTYISDKCIAKYKDNIISISKIIHDTNKIYDIDKYLI